MSDLPPFYNTSQAAEILGKTKRTIQRWCQSGRFPHAQPLHPASARSEYIIPASDVQAELSRITVSSTHEQRP